MKYSQNSLYFESDEKIPVLKGTGFSSVSKRPTIIGVILAGFMLARLPQSLGAGSAW